MRKLRFLFMLFTFCSGLLSNAQHNAGHQGKILMIASNPSVSGTTGWPIGVWYAELTHPYWVFSEAGYTVEIASPDGGEILFDGFSDPEDASRYAAFDYISLGFKKDSARMALTRNTLRLSDVNPAEYKAIFLCGGQGPMFTFYKNKAVADFFSRFWQTGKPAAAICHGTCVLLDARLPDGKFLVEGKRWTGFANSEENYADAYVGMKIQPFRIEDEARKMPNSRFETGAMFSSFAIRDGNLITGQQQHSGARAAELVLQALEDDKKRYPTYVLVHGAWADESAWGAVRNLLALQANVEVVNLPAHGADDRKTAGLSDYVKAVSLAVNKYPGKVTLVGHSMAGMIISQVAEQIPQKIEKLVYVSAYLPKNGENLQGINRAFYGKDPEGIFEFNKDYSLISIRKEKIASMVCADCPDEMKAMLLKYHRPEPMKGFTDKVTLSERFRGVPKFYISTKNDDAVPYALQQKMIRANGTVKRTEEMETAHLPFVVQPQAFVNILKKLR